MEIECDLERKMMGCSVPSQCGMSHTDERERERGTLIRVLRPFCVLFLGGGAPPSVCSGVDKKTKLEWEEGVGEETELSLTDALS